MYKIKPFSHGRLAVDNAQLVTGFIYPHFWHILMGPVSSMGMNYAYR